MDTTRDPVHVIFVNSLQLIQRHHRLIYCSPRDLRPLNEAANGLKREQAKKEKSKDKLIVFYFSSQKQLQLSLMYRKQ